MWWKLFIYWSLSTLLAAVISQASAGRGHGNRRNPSRRVKSVLQPSTVSTLETFEEDDTVPNSDVEIFEDGLDTRSFHRIVGGTDANYKDHPYQLQLAVGGRQICGATIISKYWAITAAHCLFDSDAYPVGPEAIILRAGAMNIDSGGSVHDVRKTIVHKYYDDVEYDNDIALLKVKQPFQYSPIVQRVLLPDPNEGVAEGTMGVVSGWGLLKAGGKSSPVLQDVNLPVIGYKKCKAAYRRRHVLITERMICAGFPQGRRDFCQGDSGGPFVVDGKLIGIVSWSVGCAQPGFPGVFTKVAKFRYWIKEKSGV